ncbi:MAG: tRNA (guanine-N1)-methyltransferase [Candidatus Aenigmatarchaeota archaeon]|nr:MAG: tRNA (guanine-N1)-methyltransferase [Candidatus Aenigmarchaeota archaeon]
MNLKQVLEKRGIKGAPKSFDQIGDIAIIEIPDKLKNYEKIIGQTVLDLHKNIRTVLKKASPRTGKYRLRKLKLIAGVNKSITEHKESGCSFLLNVRTCYFSPREGTERIRVAEKVRKGEYVMVFFAGVGPFPIIISKKTKASGVVGIELNPACVRYFRRNIVLNKLTNVRAIQGDVQKVAKEFYGSCDRVLMPLPETGYKYLVYAIRCLKPEGIVHFYFISPEDEINKWKKLVRREASKLKRKAKIKEIKKVLPYGPKIYKWRIDFIVS